MIPAISACASRPVWNRVGVLLAQAVVIGIAIFNLSLLMHTNVLSDMNAYWEAALRLRDGQALYPALLDTQAADVYRYAPWFALVWVPLTFLPYSIVGVGWIAVLLVAGGWVLWRIGSPPLTFFIGPLLLQVALIGNVHTLVIASLLWGLERRSGPLWIGLAASLKGLPIVLALVYAGRREWRKLAATLFIAALFVVPMLAFDLSSYPVSDGGGLPHHYGLPWPWAAVILAGGTLACARSRYGWLVAATTLLFGSPGAHPYHLTYPLLGLTRFAARPAIATSHQEVGERAG